MCELFGMSSMKKLELNKLLLKIFSHGVNHPNGWGMAFFMETQYLWKNSPKHHIKAFT